ncbi:recombinase family protein [Halalkalicoccus salilacus]|uniref:recombinase family protein n=1 Tax=Halalkalicoccus salilacus TaxID=3117459 RepID=UPI00300E8ADD
MNGHTALYAHVSTDDQSHARQKEETWGYATETLDVDPSEIEVYEDTGTGRDTRRDGYQELMQHVRDGEVARVIVLEVSRLSRSMRDLATTVETIVDESDTGLHILDMSLALEPGDDDPYQRAFLNIMGKLTHRSASTVSVSTGSKANCKSSARTVQSRQLSG